VEDSKKPTNAVAEISTETLTKLASREEDIRQSGLIDIFEQHLPAIPKDYVFKNRDRQFVADALNVAFDLIGGIPRLAQYGHENPGEFYKLYARLLPEAEKKDSGPAVVQVFHNVPASALDMGDVVDMDDDEDE
jgi:hypothetical protein